MKTVKGSIYQLNKDNSETTFEYNFSTDAANDKANKFDKLSAYVAAKLFKAKKLNDTFAAKGQRRLGLAKTKPLYFYLSIDGNVVFQNEISEDLKLQITLKNSTEADIAEVLEACLEFTNEDVKF